MNWRQLFGLKPKVSVPAKTINRLEIRKILLDTFRVYDIEHVNFDRDIYITPTLDQVIKFLWDNEINHEIYSDSFRCGEYAKLLALDAARKDWACASIKIKLDTAKNLHYVVIFILDDLSVYVIEPQTDKVYPRPPDDYLFIRADFT